MKKILTILSGLFIALGLSAQTRIADKQEVFGTWTKSQSPYIILGEAIVPKGRTLTIEPGVVIQFKAGKNKDYRLDNILNPQFDCGFLRVNGTIIAKGNFNNLIKFTSLGYSGTWGNVSIYSRNKENLLEYCWFESSYFIRSVIPGDNATGAVTFNNADGTVRNCYFINNGWGALNCKNGSSPLFINNTVVGNNYGIECNSASNPRITNSILWDNKESFYLNGGSSPTIEYSIIPINGIPSDIKDGGGNLKGIPPNFTDPKNNNYTLKESSIGYNKGKGGVNIGVLYTSDNTQYTVKREKEEDYSAKTSKADNVAPKDDFVANLPPMLSVQDLTLSKSTLNAEETIQLTITLKNIGSGDANDVYVNLACDLKGLVFPSRTNFPKIEKNGGAKSVNINISGTTDLPTDEAIIKIEVVEPNFKVKIQGKQLKFPTREFLKPELLIAKFAVLENLSTNPNNQIDINEQIDVKFAVQNVGQGDAENVNVAITNSQNGVMLLGVVDNSGNLIRRNPTFASVASGKFETITYRYFVNSEFTSNQLTFSISATEKNNKYGFNQTKSVEINKVLQEEGYIRTVASIDQKEKGRIIIEDIPDFVSDVDQDIPTSTSVNDKTFAVIIGNETYSREIAVKYALNDARIFKQYLKKTLGLPNNNIHYIENATYGQILDAIKWISDVISAYQGQAKVIFYYAGHGMPDEQTKSAYILPVDGNSQNTASAVKLGDVYSKLSEHPSISVTVFLDACFSGATRESNETMLAQGRGVKVTPKNDLLSGNIVVFSAAKGDETAFPYNEKQHGMFTYFLLKKLQESSGSASLNEISSFVITNVTQHSVVVNKKSQTPQVNASVQFGQGWQNIKLK
jgi:hypothetical protein